MNMPKVTLAIPAYNEEKNLEKTLTAILGQSFSDFELLLGDNCSTDGTRAVMERFARKDARIRILPSDQNRGAVWNFGRLLAEARGEYFAWIGAHDRYSQEWLAELMQVMIANPTVVLAYPLCRRVLPDGTVMNKEEQPLDTRGMTPANRLKAICYHHGAGERIYGLYRTAAAKQCPVTVVIRWDALFLARLAFLGDAIGIDKPLWFRYYDKQPRKAHDYVYFANALARQYRIVYQANQKLGIHHWLPHYYHLFCLWKDAFFALFSGKTERLVLTYHAAGAYHRRNKKNVGPEWRSFLRHYGEMLGLRPLWQFIRAGNQ